MVMFCVSFDFGLSKDTFVYAKFQLWDQDKEEVCFARSCTVLGEGGGGWGEELERDGVRKSSIQFHGLFGVLVDHVKRG